MQLSARRVDILWASATRGAPHSTTYPDPPMSYTFARMLSKPGVKGNTSPFVLLVWDAQGNFLGVVDEPEARRLGWRYNTSIPRP